MWFYVFDTDFIYFYYSLLTKYFRVSIHHLSNMSFNYKDELNLVGGKEILAAAAEKIIEDYQAHTTAETRLVEDLEKAVDKWKDELLEEIKKTIHNKQLKLHAKMESDMTKIQDQLSSLEAKEEEMGKFSDALHTMLAKDVKPLQ